MKTEYNFLKFILLFSIFIKPLSAMMQGENSVCRVEVSSSVMKSSENFLNNLDNSSLTHIVSFLFLPDIMQLRASCHRFSRNWLKKAIPANIDFLHRTCQLGFFKDSLKITSNKNKLLSLLNFFQDVDVSRPFLRIAVCEKIFKEILYDNSFTYPFKNVKSLLLNLGNEDSKWISITSIFETKGLNNLEGLYFLNQMMDGENLKKVLETLPNLKNLGCFILDIKDGRRKNFKLTNGSLIQTINQSRYAPNYETLIFPQTHFRFQNSKEKIFLEKNNVYFNNLLSLKTLFFGNISNFPIEPPPIKDLSTVKKFLPKLTNLYTSSLIRKSSLENNNLSHHQIHIPIAKASIPSDRDKFLFVNHLFFISKEFLLEDHYYPKEESDKFPSLNYSIEKIQAMYRPQDIEAIKDLRHIIMA